MTSVKEDLNAEPAGDEKNKNHCLEYRKTYLVEKAELIRVTRKRYNQANIEAKRVYEMNRYYGNEQVRNALNARSSIRQVIIKGNGSVQNRRIIKLIGCFRYEFIEHLEKQFRDGMSWENYGHVWEIDHIIPLSRFDLTKKEELLKACFYKNLQPLLVIENKIKGNKILINAR